ncbi:TyrR/PhhR family helix-turn-helix DNA-binding protein [Planctobacterium marinum]|uniref:TyrR family transcriptional regulator n=1 Tax=Planctobacterium marinum TaxID=1631968 RepID=A0AA48HNF5_9ALTE|nr:TyrR family transcriptional regulator [Planctobacterium marinum]
MRLEITCHDRLGITQDVLDILVKYNIDLRGIEIDPAGKIFLSFPTIEFNEFQHLMPEIRKLSGVTDVKTTPFMPIERERNELNAILETLPDPVFSVDAKGRIMLTNDAAASSLDEERQSLLGIQVSELVKGFNVVKWLESKDINIQAHKVKFVEQDFLADFFPVFVPDSSQSPILAGAVILLKSEFRLGQQFSVFHQPGEESFNHIFAQSTAMKRTVREAKKFAESNLPLLFFGETGTGKETLARACHSITAGSEKVFCQVVVTGKSDEELDGILFGDNTTPGVLNDEQNGTVLLKEINDLSAFIQAKLWAWLQQNEKQYQSGNSESKQARLMVTTQEDISLAVTEGKFREDLYFRLTSLVLPVPSLRDRKGDVIGLAELFLKQQALRMGKRVPKLSRAAVDLLQAHSWPGNVRQLENTVCRAMLTATGREIHKENIQLPGNASGFSFSSTDFEGTLDEAVKKFEKSLLRQLYPSYPSTRQLAKKLGLSHTAIANKLREYGISRKTIKI